MNTHSYHRTKRVPMIARIIVMVVGGLALAAVMAFAFGYFVMLLWNWLMPILFGLPEITYWMAFGIVILGKLIFGGFGGGHSHSKDKCDDRDGKEYFKAWAKHGTPPWKHKKDQDFKKWKYYSEYWKDEGKEAYDEYVKKRQENKGVDRDITPHEEV
jgi:hypothetical protein